jgi:NAD(P)H-hydrate epimerase
VQIARFSPRESPDFTANLERLRGTPLKVTELPAGTLPTGEESEVIIDALLGSGFNKPVAGYLKALIKHVNALHKKVVSIDIPSGFPPEGIIDPDAEIVNSELTICFQRPKINFFFPESARALKRFAVVPIGLDEQFIDSQPSEWKLVEEADIRSKLVARAPFSHKGDYGHALIVAGQEATMGAALLCADACLHSGAGLTSACIPESGTVALNARSPEIMSMLRKNNIPSGLFEKYSVVAVGPGFGTDDEATGLLQNVFTGNQRSMVLDADALTILSKSPGLWSSIPPMSILTPHMKEFDRMFGEHNSWWERIKTSSRV